MQKATKFKMEEKLANMEERKKKRAKKKLNAKNKKRIMGVLSV